MGSRPPPQECCSFVETMEGMVGGGCIAGVIGSGKYLVVGLRSTPGGLVGASRAVRINAPRWAANGAGYFGLSTTLECGLARARGKSDMWNCVPASAATFGILAMCQRKPLRATAGWALLGGCFELALNSEVGDRLIQKLIKPFE